MWSFLCQYHSLAQIWTRLLKSHVFGIIGKLDVNQYIYPYTFNQNICTDLWVIQSVIISQGPFTPLENRIIWLIRSHALTDSRPTLTIVVRPFFSLAFPTVRFSVLIMFYTFSFCPYFKFQYFCVFIVIR